MKILVDVLRMLRKYFSTTFVASSLINEICECCVRGHGDIVLRVVKQKMRGTNDNRVKALLLSHFIATQTNYKLFKHIKVTKWKLCECEKNTTFAMESKEVRCLYTIYSQYVVHFHEFNSNYNDYLNNLKITQNNTTNKVDIHADRNEDVNMFNIMRKSAMRLFSICDFFMTTFIEGKSTNTFLKIAVSMCYCDMKRLLQVVSTCIKIENRMSNDNTKDNDKTFGVEYMRCRMYWITQQLSIEGVGIVLKTTQTQKVKSKQFKVHLRKTNNKKHIKRGFPR
ncbi:hypothetical protein EIN_275840 [Entamoeba invadens IP1]|uniref:Uncharacterized protein n=1 Tax=Entamoeba invadens IP1 TaxID=370355 RepID=A0A0A1UGB8_ENTIV|nr:hypothetical protein EIN_275840 [Entamoeba invadens IP1]ELP92515.1 hypothetical protein EIN_275840 [Entamoeba invadens IP1]|eukprot:XP_004259286.1 hypothetical protein EIN_275840 [Entamoeba invadens IP1]